MTRFTASVLFFLGSAALASASDPIRLDGKMAAALYASLPQEIAETHPGSIVKTADEVACISSPHHGAGVSASCELKTTTGQRIQLSGESAQTLFLNLPLDLREIHPGAILKKAPKVNCVSFPSHGSGPNFLCSITR